MTKPFWSITRHLPQYAVLSGDLVTLLCPLCGSPAGKRGDNAPTVEEGPQGRFFTSMLLSCSNPDCTSHDDCAMMLRTFGAAALIEVEGPAR